MSKKVFSVLLILVICVNFAGLFSCIFVDDSSLYATISKSFVQSGNYFDIYVSGADWLDKPHFPFWICAFSMEIFGINTFAYKLPSLIFFLLGLFYTYKLAKALYNKQIAYMATLILGSAIHIIVSNNDTRAEAILLGLVIGGTYYLYKFSLNFSIRNLILSSMFCAAAIMTKGIFVLIIYYSAIFGHLFVKRDYKALFNYKWIFTFILTFIFTLPELYSVYSQFDLHPEKTVFGRNGVSGIKFFLWDSQFGRFFSTGPITRSGDVFFFLHTLLWAFAPWAVIGYTSLFHYGKSLIKRNLSDEYITFFGFIVMFLLFSLSSFQLPFYTNIIFPFIAIMCAALIINYSENKIISSIYKASVWLYSIIFVLLIGLAEYFLNEGISSTAIVIYVTSIISLLLLFRFLNQKTTVKYFIYGITFTMIFALYLNVEFLPQLLKYQSGVEAALYINKNNPQDDTIITNLKDRTFEYYIDDKFVDIGNISDLKNVAGYKNSIVYTNANSLDELSESNIKYKVLRTFNHFFITKVTPEFLNYRTRDKAVKKRYLIKIL